MLHEPKRQPEGLIQVILVFDMMLFLQSTRPGSIPVTF